ncbi:MAG: hypothetical protein ACM3PP_10810, partial [Candidatus Saccharibacteria bacterium]
FLFEFATGCGDKKPEINANLVDLKIDNAGKPSFLPGNKGIYYAGNGHIDHIIDAQGKDHVLMLLKEYDRGVIVWSRKGDKIAFTGRPRGAKTRSNIYIANSDGSNPRIIAVPPIDNVF